MVSEQEKMDCLAALDRAWRGAEPPRAAFVSGSRVVDLAHAYSDLDVHVLGEEGECDRVSVDTESGPVELNVLSPSEFGVLSPFLGRYVATKADRGPLGFSEERMKDLVRIGVSEVLIDADSLMEPEATRRSVLGKWCVGWHALKCASFLEDCRGSLDVGRWETGLRCARFALEHSVEASLAAAGDTYFSWKFSVDRVRRTFSQDPRAQDLVEMLLDSGVLWHAEERRRRESGVTRSLETAWYAAALMSVAVERAFGASELEAAQILPKPLSSLDATDTVISPWFVPLIYSDSYSLMGLDRGFRVGHGVLDAWFCATEGISVGRLEGDPALAQTISSLRERGMVTTPGGIYSRSARGGDDS